MESRARKSSGSLLGAGIGLFALALGARALSWREVFGEARFAFVGNDAFYHARRVLYSIEHWPRVLDRDPYINFPHGGEPIWSPLFDWSAAALARLLGIAPGLDGSPDALHTLLAWLPPLLGALTVCVGAGLAARFAGARVGLLAGTLLALLPAHVSYARIGFFDHHVAIALFSVALLGAAAAWLDRAPGRAHLDLLGAAALGLAIGLCLLLWPGMILHVGLVDAVALAFVLSRSVAGEARVAALSLALAHGLAFVLVAPFALGRNWELWGSFSPAVLCAFQPWFLASGAVAFAALAASLRSAAAELSIPRRMASALAPGLLVLALSFLLLPELREAPAEAWRWFGKAESFQAEVAESRSLFLHRGQLDLWTAALQLTPFFYFLPALLVVGILALRRSPKAWPGILLFVWIATLATATVVQMRFANSLAPAWCLALALAAHWAWRGLAARSARDRRLAIAGLALLLLVSLSYYRGGLLDQWGWLQGRPIDSTPFRERARLLAELSEWARAGTPETTGWLDATVLPEYAILAPWTDGHRLAYWSRRPTNTNNFGDDIGEENLVLGSRYYLGDEELALRELQPVLGFRYALFEYRRTRGLRDFGPSSLISRLYFGDGSEADSALVVRDHEPTRLNTSVPALVRHRLVYETAPKPQSPGERPAFKLYELVAGARVEGQANPGVRVEARIEIETAIGRRFEYLTSTRADSGGRYSLRLPYATTGSPSAHAQGGVQSGASYRLQAGEREADLRVPERAVLEGLALPGPDLKAVQ